MTFFNLIWVTTLAIFFFSIFQLIFIFNFFLFVLIMHLLIMIGAILKRPRTPPTNNPVMDYQTADSEHVLKRSRPFGVTDEV